MLSVVSTLVLALGGSAAAAAARGNEIDGGALPTTSTTTTTSNLMRAKEGTTTTTTTSSSSSLWNGLLTQLKKTLLFGPQRREGDSNYYYSLRRRQRRHLAIGDFDDINGLISGAEFSFPELDALSFTVWIFTININNIRCGNVAVGDIVVSYERPTDQRLIYNIDVVEFDLVCTFEVESNLFDGDGQLTTDNNSVGVSLQFDSMNDDGFETDPPTSLIIDPNQPCRADIANLDVSFTGGGFGGSLANLATSLLSSTLESTVEEQICSLVDDLVGDGLGDELLASINEVLAPLDTTGGAEVDFLDPLGPENSLSETETETESETSNWLNYQESELASFLLLTLNELFGGTPEPGINAFVQDNLLEEDGSLTLDISDALNLTDAFNLTTDTDTDTTTTIVNITEDGGIVVWDDHNNLTQATIVLTSVRVLGLDTFTSFGPFEAIGNYTLRTAASLSTIRVVVSLNLDIRPSTLPGSLQQSNSNNNNNNNPNDASPIIADNATIVFGADDIEATLTALLGIDETKAINNNANNNPDTLVDCLLGSVERVETSSVSLNVGSLPEPTLNGVSPGLDRIATNLAQATWIMYEASLLRSIEDIIQQSLGNVLLPIDQLVAAASSSSSSTSTTCAEDENVVPLTSATPSSVPSLVPSAVPSSVPSSVPSPVPSPVPSKSPSSEPTESSGGGSGNFCFSSKTSVQLENGNTVTMDLLKLGDKVLVSMSSSSSSSDDGTNNNKYETIYGFGHFDTTSQVEYLQIHTTSQQQQQQQQQQGPLELTPNHLLFVDDNDNNGHTVIVPASALKVGDTLSAGSIVVVSIQTITRTGAFAPYTPSGQLVTNGILSSCFASLDKDTSLVTIGSGYYEIPLLTYHQLGLWFESPRRLLCRLEDCRRYELYVKGGLSQWVPLEGFLWMKRQPILVSGTIFLFGLVVLGVVNVVEMMMMTMMMLFLNPVLWWSSLIIIVLVALWMMGQTTTTKGRRHRLFGVSVGTKKKVE